MMLSQMVNVTTSEIKKGRYDSKDLEGQVVWLDENHIMVFLNETIQRLDKNQHFHPDEGSLIRVDGRVFRCTQLHKFGRPAHFALEAADIAA